MFFFQFSLKYVYEFIRRVLHSKKCFQIVWVNLEHITNKNDIRHLPNLFEM